ncbi:MAG: biosis protein MshQ [Candidatus Poribacteria bacterium]|nr:biosis protein MshQ [Candidatus Poribacteria bacterium]
MVTASDTFTTEIFKDGIFTVVLWIKAKRSGNEWQQIFRAGPDPNDTIFLNNNGTLSWRGMVKGVWGGGMCETAANAVPADTWTHVAVVGDAKNFRDYIDGKLAKESVFQATRGNNKEYMIGGYSGGESYNGAVDEFAVFKASLKEAEINSIMSKGVLGATAVDSTSKLATRWGSLKLNP